MGVENEGPNLAASGGTWLARCGAEAAARIELPAVGYRLYLENVAGLD